MKIEDIDFGRRIIYKGKSHNVVAFNDIEELLCIRPIKAKDTDLYDVWVRIENVELSNILKISFGNIHE